MCFPFPSSESPSVFFIFSLGFCRVPRCLESYLLTLILQTKRTTSSPVSSTRPSTTLQNRIEELRERCEGVGDDDDIPTEDQSLRPTSKHLSMASVKTTEKERSKTTDRKLLILTVKTTRMALKMTTYPSANPPLLTLTLTFPDGENS
jgi:hypothetical protein